MVVAGRLLLLRSVCEASPPSTTLQDIASNYHKGSIAKVVLKKGKSQLFKDGSPMVYSGAVDRIVGRPPPKTGDMVLVADGTEKPIAWGFYNSVSMFCVRLMQFEDDALREASCALNVEKLLQMRIDAAVKLRKELGLPSSSTNAYRLINSEGDRLSGLIVDIFGDTAVIASSAAWVEKYSDQIMDCILKVSGVNHLSWRPSIEILKEEGIDLASSMEMNVSCGPQSVKVVENGVSYMISLEGQKTGFYADQRENRQFISTIAEGRSVLDLCCYTGGFALNAANGGALAITGIDQLIAQSKIWGEIGVDSSLPALEIAKENIILNDLDPGRISFLKHDATEFMKGAVSRGEEWDIVILDPPKLAPRKKALHNASGMYRNLNSLAMRLTKSGGIMMTCSCSGAMTQSGTFLRILQGAASMAGRRITVLRQAGAACDHPIDPSYPEGEYLSNVLLRVL